MKKLIILLLLLPSCDRYNQVIYGKAVPLQPSPISHPKLPVVQADQEVWVLMGQSNMTINNDVNFTADEHIHTAGIWGDGLAGVGFAFAIKRRERGVKDVILIQCAIGGTPIDRWQASGDLYQYCKELMSPHKDEITGILFAQGEAEAGADHEVDWRNKFESMANDAHNYIGRPIPIIFDQIGQFNYPGLDTPPYTSHIKQEQANVNLPNVYMIKTDDVYAALGWHHNKNEFLIIGSRIESLVEGIIN